MNTQQPETSAEIVQKSPEEQEKPEEAVETVGFFELFRFANRTDKILMLLGGIGAAAMGCALPSFALLWGNITDAFGDGSDIVDSSRKVMANFFEIGAGAFFASWLMFACWMIAGQRQGIECRKQYLKSLLKQEIGWFDTVNQSELASKFASDSFAFEGAIGEKVSTIIMTISMFIAGFVIAFIKGWLMTLVLLSSLPLIGISGYFFITSVQRKDKVLEKDYSIAGGKAEQAISSIKTVKQLNGEAFESEQYQYSLKHASSKVIRFSILMGAGIGAVFLSMLISYSLGFWFGSHCVEGSSRCSPDLNGGSKYTAGEVLIVFFSILMAGFNLSQMTPALQKIAEGRSAASRIFKIIDREPLIKSKENAITPTEFKGVFRFEDVTFAYPKDKKKNILENLSLVISDNSTAFVGESGCGKSTIFQLIMRFYDPDGGRITLDGVDLKNLNLIWLRNQIGYVGQEPVLFATTIKQNLLFGKEDATDQEINAALHRAEAYDFVMQLQDKIQTYVGTGGGQISGGQKQRIAIARALLKNPKVLLLDEATSALDRRNQKLIQQTLNEISSEKITLTIAHRVKTIMNAQKIFVLEKGKIGEQGRFQDLKRYKAVQMQKQMEEHIHPSKKGAKITKQTNPEGFLDLAAADNQIEQAVQPELTRQQKEKKKTEELLEKYDKSIFGRIFSYSSERKLYFAFGIIAAILNGCIFPAFSIFLAKMLAALVQFNNDPVQARIDADHYALAFLIIAIMSFFTNTLQTTLFAYVGSDITEKIRKEVFEKIMKMPVPWFDNPRNNSGALSARLASDCLIVNGLTTTYIAITLQNIATLLAGIIIAFIFQWRTSLVALGLIPLMIIAGAVQMKFNSGFSDKTDGAFKESSNIITESMNNIRTVTSFGYEDLIERRYEVLLKEPMEIGVKKGHVSGILFGFSQFIMFMVFALIFYFGTIFIRDNGVSIGDVFTAIYAIMFAGMTAGNNSHFMPDVVAARTAAVNLFVILDEEDEDQIQLKNQSKLISTGKIEGNIQFKNVSFKYETRNDYVFENMSFSIKAGSKVAFVGPSGCGKSTILQILQRFYFHDKGEVLIDGVDIKQYNIHFLRECFGVVSQEPVLFNDTIRYNIKYNKSDADEKQIKSAAIQSNFNPDDERFDDFKHQKNENEESMKGKGFDKNVGVKGSHISGGQKQRVAIARAILRNPQILLLDEATSALDSANQQKVQESLDHIMKNKTSISIAHRIDTIKNSNEILVFEKGEIVERGTYSQLISKKGFFFNLEQGTQFV